MKKLPIQETPEMRVQPCGGKIPAGGNGRHSSVPAWRVAVGRGAWWVTAYRVAKESDTTEAT